MFCFQQNSDIYFWKKKGNILLHNENVNNFDLLKSKWKVNLFFIRFFHYVQIKLVLPLMIIYIVD